MKSSITRRTALHAAALSLAMLTLPAWAQTYPDRPIKLVVPFAVGGGTDILARELAPGLSKALGQPVIVENRGGAGGNIGTVAVASAAADGYTVLFGSNSMSINAGLYKELPFDPIRSFDPIGMVATAPLVLVVHPDQPVRQVRDLVDAAKAKPGTLNWGAPGTGTPHHLASELFNRMTGAPITHVQYRGGGPSIVDLVGGHVQAGMQTLSSVRPHIEAGRLRAIGVATAARSPLLPDVPTIAEAGVPGYEANLWYGLFVPAGTPQPILQALNVALNRVLNRTDLQAHFAKQGYEPQPGTPQALEKLLADDLARSAKVIADADIRPE